MLSRKLGVSLIRSSTCPAPRKLLSRRSSPHLLSRTLLGTSLGQPFMSGTATSAAARPAGPAIPDVFMETSDPDITYFQDHQKNALRPTPAEQMRTMVASVRTGVLSTIAVMTEIEGYPNANVVEFAVDSEGRPLFATSRLSTHTRDLLKNPRCSLAVSAPGFKSLKDSRMSLVGEVVEVTDPALRGQLRATFLQQLPHAFYIDFGDFHFFRMDLKTARYNFTFGTAGKVSVEEYSAAQPDPIAPFSGPVCGHMNDDHEADTIAIIKHYTRLTVEKAKMDELDKLGVTCSVTRNGASFKLRLPFPRLVTDRKGIKEALVEMTKAAKAAS